MDRRRRRLIITLSAIAAVTLIGMMLHTVVNTLLRTVANAPIYGTYEVVESWYLPLIGLVGILAAHLQGEHIQVTALVGTMARRDQKYLRAFRAALCALLCFFVAVSSFLRGLGDAEVGMTAGVTSIPIWPIILLVPAMFLALGCFYASDLIADLRGEGRRAAQTSVAHARGDSHVHDAR